MTTEPKISVLWVDDEINHFDASIADLTDRGFEVTKTSSIPSALKQIQKRSFDVILTDFHLPPDNAIDFIRHARAKRANTLIVILSGYLHSENVREALSQLKTNIIAVDKADLAERGPRFADRLHAFVRDKEEFSHGIAFESTKATTLRLKFTDGNKPILTCTLSASAKSFVSYEWLLDNNLVKVDRDAPTTTQLTFGDTVMHGIYLKHSCILIGPSGHTLMVAFRFFAVMDWADSIFARTSTHNFALVGQDFLKENSLSFEIKIKDRNESFGYEDYPVWPVSGMAPRAYPAKVAPVKTTLPSESRIKTQVDALILKGGGVKGLAFAGAIRELEAYFDFNAFVGTSAGSVAATLLAAGATAAELETSFREKSFRDFLDGSAWAAPWNVIIHGGIHRGYGFVNWFRTELHKYIPKAAEVKMLDLPKRAVVYATSRGEGEVTFDKVGEHRDTAVHAAVRCSMSIPFFFRPQVVDGRPVYDGGWLANYPVQIFLEQERRRRPDGPPPTFLALYLGTDKRRPIDPVSQLSELLSVAVERNDRKIIDLYRSQTILIDTSPVGTIDFDLTDLEKDFLVLQGRVSALSFLKGRGLLNDLELEALSSAQPRVEVLRAEVIAARKKRRIKFWSSIAVAAAVCAILIATGIYIGGESCTLFGYCGESWEDSLAALARFLERTR